MPEIMVIQAEERVWKSPNEIGQFALRIRADHCKIFAYQDATLPKPLEHAIGTKIGANARCNGNNGSFEIAIRGG